MKKRLRQLTALLCAALALPLCGCDGDIYSHTREIGQLMIIQTMGFDSAGDSVVLTAATGTGNTPKPALLTATAPSVNIAQDILQDYSTSEELFYAHTAYVVIGKDAAAADITQYLDYVNRAVEIRFDVPFFVVLNGSASELVLGAGKAEGSSDSSSGGESGSSGQQQSSAANYDVTDVLRALERNLNAQGDCIVFSAADIMAAAAMNGSALICAVRTVPADKTIVGTGGSLAALPAGYAVIKDGRQVGELGIDCAPGVSILKNRFGPAYAAVKVDGSTVTVQFDKSDCKIKPVLRNGALRGLSVEVKLSAALSEARGNPDIEKLNEALGAMIKAQLEQVLRTSAELRCDFLQLGNILELGDPTGMRGMTVQFQELMPELDYNIYVEAEVNRSFDMSLV